MDEDYQKFSDVGEAGQIEADLELQQHNKLVQVRYVALSKIVVSLLIY